MNIRGEVIKTAIRWISKLYLFLNQGIKVKSLREKLTQTSTIGFYPNSVDKQYFVIWLVLTGGVVDLGGLGHPLAGLLEGLEDGGDATEEGRRWEPIHQVLTLTCAFVLRLIFLTEKCFGLKSIRNTIPIIYKSFLKHQFCFIQVSYNESDKFRNTNE